MHVQKRPGRHVEVRAVVKGAVPHYEVVKGGEKQEVVERLFIIVREQGVLNDEVGQ